MHILVLPSWYKSDQYPYLGSFFEEQARALMKAGHQVAVFFPAFYPVSTLFNKKPDYKGIHIDNGLLTYVSIIQGIIPSSQKINNNHIRWQSYFLFKKYINKNGKPDIMHAHSVFDAGIIAEFLSQKFNIPFVITEHLTHFAGSLSNDVFKLNLSRNIFNHAACSIAVSNQFKHDLERELDLKPSVFTVVYNMVAGHFYEKFKERTYTPGEEFVFFTNSFLNERKNHILLFDALQILIRSQYKIRLVVGGSGEQMSVLKKYVNEKNLAEYVVFLGGLSRASVKEEIDKSHAFLLGSKLETFGVVLIESIISGRPVISTNCGGPAEIIDHDNGYLVDTFNPVDFARAMEKMISNYSTFDQKKMREHCYKRFSEETITNQLVALYRKACQK